MDLQITSQPPSTGNLSEDPSAAATAMPQAPNRPKTDFDSTRRAMSPTPELIQAGEKAMAELGLTGPMVSIQITPWWATWYSHPASGSREDYARAAFDHRSDAQRHTAKSQKYRDQKLEIQQQLVWTRDYRRFQKSGVDLDTMSVKTRKFDTCPPPLPWNREEDDDENTTTAAWDNQNWVDGERPTDLRNWRFEWDRKDAPKKQYRKAWKKMVMHRGMARVCMTHAYECALKALEAPMDQRFWGEFFG